jgi:hypothetical protein
LRAIGKVIHGDDIKLPFVVAGKSLFTFRLRGRILARTFDPAPGSLPDPAESVFSDGRDIVFIQARPLPEPLPRLSFGRRTVRYVTTQYRRHYVDLRNDVPSCFERRSAAARRTLRRSIHQFEREFAGQPIFREYKHPGEMVEFHALAHKLSILTGRGRKALPGDAAFQQELVRLAERDAVRGFILFSGDIPVAFDLCRVRGDYVSGDMCGYDSEYAKWSPGSVLRYCVLNRLAEEGRFTLLDLGPGEARYKESIATGSVLCANVFYFRSKLRYLGIVGFHLALTATSRAIVELLDAMHLRQRLKAPLAPRSRPEAHAVQE